MNGEAGAPPARLAPARLVATNLLLPLAAGAACVLAFAPFYAWPLAIAGVAVLFHVWAQSGSPRQAALSGFAFGLGYFLAGVSWVFVSLHYYGAMHWALAAIATFAFCAYLAIFPAGAGWLTLRMARGRSAGARLALAAAAMTLTEWLRGWLFTGFPWLNLGTSQAPSSPLAGYAPLLGAYGTSLAVAAAGAIVAALAASRGKPRARLMLGTAFAAILLVGGLARWVEWTTPAGPPVEVALLQGNVAQEVKWREELRRPILEAYAAMIRGAPARIVVIPETALPAFLDQLPADYVASLREHARSQGKDILIGTVERNARGGDVDYFNSVVSLTGDGTNTYRKRHLVPFGEFIPTGFGWVLRVLHIPMSDFARGGARQPALVAGGIPLGIAICYEDIFGEEVIDHLPAAQLLVNVSNDAWFGRSLAAEQHLQSSQMRALETGRWMVRSTNTGASAAIDERGQVVSRLPVFTAGTLVEKVQPRGGLTPYALLGNGPALLLAVALGAIAFGGRRR